MRRPICQSKVKLKALQYRQFSEKTSLFSKHPENLVIKAISPLLFQSFSDDPGIVGRMQEVTNQLTATSIDALTGVFHIIPLTHRTLIGLA